MSAASEEVAVQTGQPKVAFIRKGRRSTQQNQRKRAQLSDDEQEEHTQVTDAATVAKKLNQRSGTLSAATVGAKRLKQTAAANDADNDRSSTLQVTYEASGTAASLQADMATRTLDVDGVDEKSSKPEVLAGDEAETADNIYRGLSGYKEYVNKRTDNVTQSSASRIRAGPLKGSTNVRISCRFDYQPDICKDYKETGYCGYGDSCIFMHDRGDYKTGWQLDKEWEEKQKAQNDPNRFLITSDDESDEQNDSDEDLPFACVICRKEFKDPVETKCKHFFCETCALKHHAKSPKCFVCGMSTQGIFAPAKELNAKLKEKKRRMQEREDEIRAENEKEFGETEDVAEQ